MSFIENYQGQAGYIQFVSELKRTELSMGYVFSEVSSILEKPEMKLLGWRKFQGKLSEFHELKQDILNEDGSIKEDYEGMEGYVRFAEEYFSGNMKKAYINVSAVLDKSEMKLLGWRQFQGKASEFHKLEQVILEDDYNILKDDYQGMEGYVRFAEEYVSGDMQKAYIKLYTEQRWL